MKYFEIDQIDSLPSVIDNTIHQGHVHYEAMNGIVCNYKKFSLAVRNEANEICGVLSAYTAFAEIYVDDIWVKPNYRKQGLGKNLLKDL